MLRQQHPVMASDNWVGLSKRYMLKVEVSSTYGVLSQECRERGPDSIVATTSNVIEMTALSSAVFPARLVP
jgi:hypothetical protein